MDRRRPIRNTRDVRILLAPHGTRGDVQPMIALAIALRARGHHVSFVVPDNFVRWIRAHGFDVQGDGIDVEALLRTEGARFDSLRWQMRHIAEVLVPRLFESLARASADADLIVGAGVQLAAPSIAELRGIGCTSIAFCPCAVPGGSNPPPTLRTQTLPRWINRLLWDVGGAMASFALRDPVNTARAKIDLPPIDSPLQQLIDNPVLVAADRDLAPLGDDTARSVVATDAFVFHDDTPLDPRIDAFLRHDPPAIYIGFGSMVTARAAEVARHAVIAARAVGGRALIVGGWAAIDRHVLEDDDVLTVDAVPHERVLPRVAAIVHHGGAGTTTAAARAGVPQVVLPHILDQFYWAYRVAVLGLGPRGLPVDLANADVLADRLGAALNDPAIAARVDAMAPAIRSRDGVGDAVDQLERLAVHSAAASGGRR